MHFDDKQNDPACPSFGHGLRNEKDRDWNTESSSCSTCYGSDDLMMFVLLSLH